MQVIPVLDLLGGHAVRAVRGERSQYRPIQSSLCASSDPLEVARALLAATHSRTLYIADLGAILKHGAHLSILARLCDALGSDIRLWLDAGFSDYASMKALFDDVQADHRAKLVPVFGTETLRDPQAIADATAAGIDPILSLDHHAGRSLGLLPGDASWWPRRVIVMTLDRVGASAGPDLDTFAALQAKAGARELIGAGGIRDDADLTRAAASGASAWLIASAIHDRTLNSISMPGAEPA
jgi:phosphoribosylformimino-5-aminoimidazole carboxamide ribotide isomerase